jgi:hypothetical protein
MLMIYSGQRNIPVESLDFVLQKSTQVVGEIQTFCNAKAKIRTHDRHTWHESPETKVFLRSLCERTEQRLGKHEKLQNGILVHPRAYCHLLVIFSALKQMKRNFIACKSTSHRSRRYNPSINARWLMNMQCNIRDLSITRIPYTRYYPWLL